MSKVMLAKIFDPKKSLIISWIASEKYDGYRGIWDPKIKKVFSRNGNPLNVPPWFIDLLYPYNFPIDGELWFGYGKFKECGMFRRKRVTENEWREMCPQYKVFDLPNSKKKYSERIKQIKSIIRKIRTNWTKIKKDYNLKGKCPIDNVKTRKILKNDKLKEWFQEILKKGGEGLILRNPDSVYITKRSNDMLKYKATLDHECRIIGYKLGNGKYAKSLGSFNCRWRSPNSKLVRDFYLSGINDEIRKNYLKTHPIGTIINFNYMEETNNGIPRHPHYNRIREHATNVPNI